MYEIIMSAVCIITVTLVLSYILFSKPKSLKSKLGNKKTLLSTHTTWGGKDAKQVYESLRKTKSKPIFKGNHRIN